jgi:hypothetical protein
MRKSMIGGIALALVLVGGGIWLARRSSAAAAADSETALFTSEAQGEGLAIRLDAKEPLRAVRWLQPLPGGLALCQVSTQSDRQLLAKFQDGRPTQVIAIPRPAGLSEGYFRQSEVRDAVVMGDILLLLLKADGGRREWPVVLALNPEGALIWAQRVQAEHLVADGAQIWAWGPTGAQRMPVALGSAERLGPKPERPGLPGPLRWPEEVPPPTALIPTPGGFLVSHGKGLSAWKSEGGWHHTSAPTPSPLGFSEPKGTLVKAGEILYWQPEAGLLLRVNPDAGILGAESLPAPGEALDGALLRLLGRSADGRLWFGLAAPLLPEVKAAAPSTPPTETPAEEGWKVESTPSDAALPAQTPLTADLRTAYQALLAKPMDRLYVWKPGEGSLRLVVWSQAWPKLGAPAGFPPPPGDGGLRPEAGGFLFGLEQQRWWLPLKALP